MLVFKMWTVQSRIFLVFVFCLWYPAPAKSAKIIGVFPVFGRSHHVLAVALMRGLADAGHDVTIVCSYEDKYTPNKGSYRSIVFEGFAEQFSNEPIDLFDLQDFNSLLQESIFEDYMYGVTEKVFKDPGLKKLIYDGEIFDAIIIEQFSNDALKVLAHVFKCHLIVYNSFGPFNFVNRLVANPTIISYTPQLVSTFRRPMCLQDRIYNTIIFTVEELMNHFWFLPMQDKLIHQYFPDAPSVYELTKNVSLVLVNSHETMWQAVPLVPNVISIGGFLAKPPKKLPENIQKFLDNAKEGVIFFSLGSNLKSKDLPKDKMNILLKVFGKLKHKVLWKLEGEVMGLPPNIKIGKWFPQMDILAHPNVVLFITHGGLLSMTETIYNGVPVLVIPVYGDQANNGNNAVYAGFGLSILYHDPNFTEEKFDGALNALLTNTSYKLAALKISKAFHDRPMKPLDTATYWVNYVIEHNGAPHLRVDGLHMAWYQYLLLDVVAILVATFITCVVIVVISLRLLFKLKNKNVKIKRN